MAYKMKLSYLVVILKKYEKETGNTPRRSDKICRR